jgi:sugar/nucleoside kinase (ribokinase family)
MKLRGGYMSLLVVGSIALDSVKTPQDNHKEMLGGSATYFSFGASHFTKVNLVGVVGEDFPQNYRTLFTSQMIDLTGLQVISGKTFRWSGSYEGSMNEATTLETNLNVFEDFNPIIPSSYQNSQWVFLGNINPSLQNRVLDQIRNPQIVALDTMNYWISGCLEELIKVLKRVNLLIINEQEARQLSGRSNLTAVIRSITKLGPKIIIIKRGEYGSVMYNDDEFFYTPGFPVDEVVDPTGAGDSFAGGFMGALAKLGKATKTNLRKAVIYGSAIASYNITGFGPFELTKLNSEIIESRYRDFRRLVSI